MDTMNYLENQKEVKGYNFQFFLDFPYSISNEDFLILMDEINIKISGLINLKKHKTILNIFTYYLDTELYLIKYIKKFKIRKMYNYDLKKYKETLELQNYYNNFRILLISQVAEHLTKTYNKLQKMTEFDLLKSLKHFKYYERILNYYIEYFKYNLLLEYKKKSKCNSDKMIQLEKTLKIFIEMKQLFNTIPKTKKTIFALLTI